MTPPTEPHVFLSYVHEDSAQVDELQTALESVGLKVWRDKNSISPGDDWEEAIKAAITSNSLAFLACFSEASESKEVSGQRPELILATEQLRARKPGKKWFFSVRFADVPLPHYSIGAGRSLTTYQFEDLFGTNKLAGTMRVVTAINDLFRDRGAAAPGEAPPPAAPPGTTAAQFKRDLLNPMGQADVTTHATRVVREVRASIDDPDTFPFTEPADSSTVGRLRELIRQERAYRAAVRPALECIAAGCEWGGRDHLNSWTRAINTLSKARPDAAGLIQHGGVFADFARLPAVLAMCAGAIAAVHKEKFDALRAVTLDPTIYLPRSGWGTSERVSAIHKLGIWDILPDRPTATALYVAARDEPTELTDDVLQQIATGRGRQPATPGSDYLHTVLRPVFDELEDDEFDEAFDTTEVLLALIVADAKAETGKWVRDPWIGRFARLHYEHLGGESTYQRVIAQARHALAAWGPIHAGLFGGTGSARLEAAIAELDGELDPWQRQHMPRGY